MLAGIVNDSVENGEDEGTSDEHYPPGQTPVDYEAIIQFMFNTNPEKVQRIIALANGAGLIYPAPDGSYSYTPSPDEFDQSLNTFGSLHRNEQLVNPSRPHTGNHYRGSRPSGTRPRPLGDTPGHYTSIPAGTNRRQSSVRRVSNSDLITAEVSQFASVYAQCFKHKLWKNLIRETQKKLAIFWVKINAK